MPADQIQRTVKCLSRVVLLQAFHFAAEHLRALLADGIINAVVSERIVHDAVQLVTREVTAQSRVAVFIAGILPDFANKQVFGGCRIACVSGFHCVVDAADEGVRQLVGDVQAEA